MKLLSKTLGRILKEENDMEKVDLIVFNQGDAFEFAECGNCGIEMDPDWTLDNQKLGAAPYPHSCPKCGRTFGRLVKAEEEE